MNKFGIMIKNNMKLMLRNKVMIFVVIVASLMVIAALSNAFHSLLDAAEQNKTFSVGYQMKENSCYRMLEEQLTTQLEKEGISIRKYIGEDPKEIVEQGQVDVFLDFLEDDYQIFGSGKNEIQARTMQYIMHQVTKQIEFAQMQMQAGRMPTDAELMGNRAMDFEDLAYTKTASAQDYYGMIEIIYFLSLCMVFLSVIFQAEKNSHILNRYRVSSAGNTVMYFSKLIPCFLMAWGVQVIITGGLATVLFDIHWGNPLMTFGILTLEAFAFAALGIVFLLLFHNMAVSIGLLFMLMWFFGFVGGTFETYMYSQVPDAVKEFSPLYYINRTLVEFSTMGESDYMVPCIIYLAGIVVVCVPFGILLTARRKEN